MHGKFVDVTDMTAARDRRRELGQKIIEEYGRPLICFTMNIAGPVKRSMLTDAGFGAGCEALIGELGEPLYAKYVTGKTGNEAFFIYDKSAEQLKAVCVKIEETHPFGRLFDMDVITADGTKLSREMPRRCIICGGPASACARSRAHGLAAVQSATKDILVRGAAEAIADTAVKALKKEAHLTPKPGLVDENDCGAHRDMDIELLDRSAECLRKYFRDAAIISATHEAPADELIKAGREAECVMLEQTRGINTHRGAIYAFGLMAAAYARRLVSGDDIADTVRSIAGLTAGGGSSTHGGKAASAYGARGARDEALAGYPCAFRAYEYMESGGDELGALMTVMAELDDTNLYHRGGAEGVAIARETARRALCLSGTARRDFLAKANDMFIKNNLSPGGSADMLALAIFIHDMEKREKYSDC